MRLFWHLLLADALGAVRVVAKGLDGVRVAVGAGATGLREELLPSFRPRDVPAAPVRIERGAAARRRLQAYRGLVDPGAGTFDLIFAPPRGGVPHWRGVPLCRSIPFIPHLVPRSLLWGNRLLGALGVANLPQRVALALLDHWRIVSEPGASAWFTIAQVGGAKLASLLHGAIIGILSRGRSPAELLPDA
jgi:hypothetical protein